MGLFEGALFSFLLFLDQRRRDVAVLIDASLYRRLVAEEPADFLPEFSVLRHLSDLVKHERRQCIKHVAHEALFELQLYR